MKGKILMVAAALMLAAGFSCATIISDTLATTTTTTPPMLCIDSDGGVNYGLKGATTGINGVKTDSCISYRKLMEWYCRDGKVVLAIAVCPKGCIDGACVEGKDWITTTTTATTTSSTTTATASTTTTTLNIPAFLSDIMTSLIQPEASGGCTDSDGGINFLLKSVASGANGRTSDRCVDPSRVREAYCDGGLVRTNLHKCYMGCLQGACRIKLISTTISE